MNKVPVEILHIIFEFCDSKTLFSMKKCSKKFRNIISPTSNYGESIWRKVRQNENFPNPSLLNMTDFEFLSKYYKKGCEFCPEHPKLRKIYIKFGCIRMCDTCFGKKTIRSYQLDNATYFYEHLPCETIMGYTKRGGEFEYNVYLISDVNEFRISDVDRHFLWKRAKIDVNRFYIEYQERELEIIEQRNIEKYKLWKHREKCITEIMCHLFPTLDVKYFRTFKCYLKAINQQTKLTERSVKLYKNKALKEYENISKELLMTFSEKRTRHHLRTLITK